MKKLTNTALALTLCSLTTALPSFASETNPETNTGIQATEVFGMEKGYVHPFMAVTLEDSDNIYNTRTDTRSDWKAIYSPGIWLALPAQKEIFLNLDTNNTSPGGHYKQQDKQEGFDRYQAYVLYSADIEEYHNYTERNNVSQAAEAFFQLNLRSGLSFDVYDKYSDAEDAAGTGDSTTIDEYKSNMAGIIADYQITDKVRIRADYTNFYLSYDDILNEGRDRTDDAYSLYSFYEFSVKTTFFVEYKYIDVSYDSNTSQDNEQHYVYGGINWAPTTKTSLAGKMGWLDRKNDEYGGSDTSFIFELDGSLQMTVKSKLSLSASHKLNESTIETAAYSRDTTVGATFAQDITDKITATLFANYTLSDFQGGTTSNRTDDLYTVSPSLSYIFKEWLLGEAGYTWTDRNSTDRAFDYTTNAFFIRISAGI